MIDLNVQKKEEGIPKKITSDQAKDTGMAMVFICLLIGYFGQKQYFIALSVPLLLVNMIWPGIYRPVALVWLGLSHLLGTVVSRVILTVLFFILVTPVGVTRGIFGADPLQMKKWRKNRSSVFRVRDHKFTSEDIKAPY